MLVITPVSYFVILFYLARQNKVDSALLTSDLSIPLWNIKSINSNIKNTCQNIYGSNYVYDTILQSCNVCKQTSFNSNIVDTSQIDGIGNYIQCKCANGYYIQPNTCYNTDSSGNCNDYNCLSCLSQGKVSYSDHSGCAFCGNDTLGISSSNNECQCALDEVLVEADQFGNLYNSKSCHVCPTGKRAVLINTQIAGVNYVADYYTCQSCPDVLMSMSVTSNGNSFLYSCSCPTGYSIVGVTSIGTQSCILSTNPYYTQQAAASVVVYSTTGSVNSDTFLHYYAQAASNCQYYGGAQDITSCQILANLCVLQLYNDETPVCATYLNILKDRGEIYTNNIENWVNSLPWILYSSSTACKDETYDTRVNLKTNYMQYALSSYSMNGTWLGYQSLETLFSYCVQLAPDSLGGGGTGTSTSWQIYASYYNTSFSCNLATLLNTKEILYELFLYDPDVTRYYPVPVRIQNMVFGGETVNTKEPTGFFLCATGDVLVRRFFLYDIVSGLEKGGVVPSVIRYASKIILEVALTGKHVGFIYSPVLTIEYTEVQPSTWNLEDFSTSTTTLTNTMLYTMDLTKIQNTIFGFFIAFVVVFGIVAYLRYLDWSRRNSRVVTSTVSTTSVGGLNIGVLMEIVVILIHTWVLFFFPFLVLFSWFAFLFFKVQSAPSVILPPMGDIYSTSSPYYPFTCMLYVLAFFQFGYVLNLLYKQSFADVHFIDWEPIRNTNKTAGSSTVSVWRSILVANEWVRLQTKRVVDIKLTLFLLGIIFYYSGNNATQQPDLSDNSDGVINVLLAFAIQTFWWSILSLSQYLLRFLVLQRFFIESPELVFIDLCTLSKISVFVLDEPYHGYYLHCRSPHQYADSSMFELIETLQKEEAGLTVDRSLTGAPHDVQSFQIFLTGEIKGHFEKFYSGIKNSTQSLSEILSNNAVGVNRNFNNNFQQQQTALQNNRNNNNNSNAADNLNNSKLGPKERIYNSWQETTIFLKQFVENNFNKPSLQRLVREPTYLEKLFYLAPDMSTNPDQQPSIFLTDRQYNYTKVFWLGIEMDLFLLNTLSYCLFFLWTFSTPVAILLCYLLDFLLSYLRYQIGKSVVSKKSLIDSRFLI